MMDDGVERTGQMIAIQFLLAQILAQTENIDVIERNMEESYKEFLRLAANDAEDRRMDGMIIVENFREYYTQVLDSAREIQAEP